MKGKNSLSIGWRLCTYIGTLYPQHDVLSSI